MTPEEILALYAPIDRELTELPAAMWMRVDREARQRLEGLHEGYPMFLRGTLHVSHAAFVAVKQLCYDRTAGDRPPIQLATAAPPLARTFLDSMMTLLFIGEQPAENMERFFTGGLCTEVARYHRLAAAYGGDPTWSEHIASLKAWIDSHESGRPTQRVMLSDDQKRFPRKHAKKLWPNPGRLIGECSAERREYLRFVQEWFYDHLSQDAHLSYMGMVRRSAPLHAQTSPEQQEEYRWRVFYSAAILYLALLAEVAVAADLPIERARISCAWQHLTGMSDADQLWSRRYRALLTGETNLSGVSAK